MDNPKPSSQRMGKSPPLSFSLSQAAALCGVAVHRLSEWTDCGYVRATGQGDNRRFDRHALRQILALRNATRSGPMPSRSRTGAPEPHAPRTAAPAVPSRRPEEFSVTAFPQSDVRLALQIELYFALNPSAPRTVEGLSASLNADPRQMRRILDSMAGAGVVRALRDGEIVYGPGRARLHGPNVREQRIRATRRTRVPVDGQ
jgi:hypothetical protein